jgi:hypothetical protein
MSLESILDEEVQKLVKVNETQKHNLEELRKLRKPTSSAAWQETLSIVASTPDEKVYWASTIEKDASLGKTLKQVPLSSNFVTGVPEKRNPTVQLIRLLSLASQKANVKLPKSVIIDLPKSGLPEKYAEAFFDEAD